MVEPARTLAMGQDEATGAGQPTIDAPFGKALVEIARHQADIVGLSADLAKYTDILPFRDAFPERFFNIGMAEQNLIAANAEIGVARAQLFPDVSLTGSFGGAAIGLSHLGSIYTFTPGLTQPIFNAGKLRANVRLSEAEQQQPV